MTEPIRIPVSAEVVLEARWDLPDAPAAAIVFCHPHPQHGGTMTVPLMQKVTKALVEKGMAVLRFNFRGVANSSGSWGDGIGEIDDVAAAVAAAKERFAELPLGLAGWSFGAATSLNWQAREASPLPWAGIAPPLLREGAYRLPPPEDLAPAPRTFIIGDRDQFVTVDQLRSYAAELDHAQVVVLEGSDHFFFFREEKVAEKVTAALCAACLEPSP